MVPLGAAAFLSEPDEFRLYAAGRAGAIRRGAGFGAGAGARRDRCGTSRAAVLRGLDGDGGAAGSRLARRRIGGLVWIGGLGHLALEIARVQGLRVAVVDVSEQKLEQARAAGAEIALSGSEPGKILQKEHGGVDAAIVFTAAPAAIPQAFRAVKRNGTVVLVGISRNSFELPLVEMVTRGITVKGSYLGARQDLEEAFQLLQSGAIRPHIHTHVLDEVPSLLEQMRRGGLLGRAVISF